MSLRKQPVPGHGGALPFRLDDAGQPRILDTDLAERLGFDRPRAVRQLIERRRDELEAFGPLVEVELNHVGAPRRVAPHPGSSEVPHGGEAGRLKIHRGFLLSEHQAILVTIVSNAPRAPEARYQVVQVFAAWRAGRAAAETSSASGQTVPKAGGASSRQFGPIESPVSPPALTEVDLAGVLGLAYPDEVRSLIGRHKRALKGFGALCSDPLTWLGPGGPYPAEGLRPCL